jgi:hypothetical protein
MKKNFLMPLPQRAAHWRSLDELRTRPKYSNYFHCEIIRPNTEALTKMRRVGMDHQRSGFITQPLWNMRLVLV